VTTHENCSRLRSLQEQPVFKSEIPSPERQTNFRYLL